MRHGLAAALVATNADRTPPPTQDGKRDLFVTLARRYVQRGTLVVDRSVRDDDPVDESSLRSVFAHVDHAVDPALELDDTYERPFFEQIRSEWPELAPYVLPQAPFSSIEAEDGVVGPGRRWVDFLIALPGEKPLVVELDGSQHSRQRAVDGARDAELEGSGLSTVRFGGGDGIEKLAEILGSAEEAASSLREAEGGDALSESLLGTRTAFAVVEAVAVGMLMPADTWMVRSESSATVSALALLDVFAAIDAIWETGQMPATLSIGGGSWRNPFPTTASGQDELTIEVDFGSTWSALPEADDGPDVVVRGVPLPLHAGWDREVSADRPLLREGIDQDLVERALGTISEHAFGISHFRTGQVSAITQVLRGGDACVLLPTGHGKTLVYQVCSLLRPGTTVVIAPITALIDDQEQRFVADGIDRVAAIHAARTDNRQTSRLVHRAVAEGNALVTLLAPERFQIQTFRDALGKAAELRLVNLVVIDETHCVSEWGHDFRTAYLRLGRNVRRIGAGDDDVPPPVLALTGTASPAVLRDVLRELEIDPTQQGAMQRPDTFDRPNLRFGVATGRQEDTRRLLDEVVFERIPQRFGVDPDELDDHFASRPGIVFVPWTNSIYGTAEIRDFLQERAIDRGLQPLRIGTYSGRTPGSDDGGFNKEWSQRKTETAAQFKIGAIDVLVATKAFGMGVDKPDIRWTVHVGFPSSIEAFAQEAGRAGRDGKQSECFIVSGAIDDERAHRLLAVADPGGRRSLYEDGNRQKLRDDIHRQLYFLYNSFPGDSGVGEATGGLAKFLEKYWYRGEAAQVQAMWSELREAGATPVRSVEIPFSRPAGVPKTGSRDLEQLRSMRDKALNRLALVGVIDDMTIDYGADSVTVDLANYSAATIDTATLEFARRVIPGQIGRHQRQIDSAPSGFDERVVAHATYLVDLIYATVEPSRVQSLREMWRLTVDCDDDESIRKTIISYLGDGGVVSVLQSVVEQPRIDLAADLARIDATPPVDSFDWAGGAARLLEAYPTHPLLHAVRAVGEAMRPTPDESVFSDAVAQVLDNSQSYELDPGDIGKLCSWMRDHLYGIERLRGCGFAAALLQAMASRDLGGAIDAWSPGILDGDFIDAQEPLLILARRVRSLRLESEHWSRPAREAV